MSIAVQDYESAVRAERTPSLRHRVSGVWGVPEVRWASIATGLFVLALLTQVSGGPAWVYWTLYLGCYVTGGWEPGWSGLKALRDNTLDVDLLMIAAAIGAAAIGQVFDGGLLIVIFATSGALEALATKRTEDSVRGLLDLAPATATRLTAGGEETVETSALSPGDEILVRPGDRIGGDGIVTEGASDVDQATITGEPLPVDKQVGDEVFAGTANGTGAMRVRVTRPAADTVVARIVAMVAEASASKARLQLFIEKIEQRYSVVMVAATVGLLVIPLLYGAALQPTLLRAMTFMIVASPCAVVLATMPPLLSAIANAGRHGVLVKSAIVMEQLGTVTHVAFDKTGTLTEGMPWLAEVRVTPTSSFTDDAVLALAAAAEDNSEHPLARAIVDAAHDAGLPVVTARDFQSTPGRGVNARVGNDVVEVGSPALLNEQDDPARRFVTDLEECGHTVIVVRVNHVAVAVLGLTDRLRLGAAEAVDHIATVTGTRPSLFTGDNQRSAARLADEVGIDDVRAGLLPQDKVAVVRDLESRGAKVMLVGDGINDAPALATAHVGVAMGRVGSDLALDTADAVITRDDLSTIPAVITLARRARRVVVANLVIAGTFIAVLVTWDLIGSFPLPLGVAGHEGSTILVGLNGLRLLRDAAWQNNRRAAAS